MSNPNFHPAVELPFQEGPDGRLALDPLEAIQAAQEAKERREREDSLRQSTEAFVGDLENPDIDALQDLGHMQDARAEKQKTEAAFTERTGENGANHHYHSTINAKDEARGIDNRSAEEKHRDELIEEWAKAELIGDRTKTNDVQEELLDRVMSMKYVDDTEKQRMLDAQVKSMQRRQEEYLRNVKAEDLKDLLPAERDAVVKRAEELRASEQPEPEPTDPGHPERFDQMSDDEIRNVSPAEMENMTDAERAAYLRNMHQLKAQDYQGPGDRDVHGAASGRRRPNVAGGSMIINPAAPAPGRRAATPSAAPVPPVPPRPFRPSGAPRPGLNTGDVLVAGAPVQPPRAGESGQRMSDENLLGALGDLHRHTQEQLAQSRVNRALGRIGLGPLARRNQPQQAENNQPPVVPDVHIPSLGADPFSDNPLPMGTPANAGETAVPGLPPVEVYPQEPDFRASRVAHWWSGVPRGRSWNAEMGGRVSILRGTPRVVAKTGRWALEKTGLIGAPEEEPGAANQARVEPAEPVRATARTPIAGRAPRGGQRPTGGRRPAPQANPGERQVGLDIIDPDEEL